MEEYIISLRNVDECKILYKYLLLNEYVGVRYSCLADTVESGRDIHNVIKQQQTCTVRKGSKKYIGFGTKDSTCTLEEFLATDNRLKI